MKALSIIAALGCTLFSASAQTTTIIEENFDAPGPLWATVNEGGVIAEVRDGVYHIENNSDEVFTLSWNLEMHMQEDFDIELGIRNVGKKAESFLVYDMYDDKNFTAIRIAHEGIQPYMMVYGRLANSETYSTMTQGTPKSVRMEQHTGIGPYGDQKELVYIFNGAEHGKDRQGIGSKSDEFQLQVSPGAMIEIDYFNINGSENPREKEPESFLSDARFGDATPTETKETVEAGSPMYGLIIAPKPIIELTHNSSCKFAERVYVDGQIEAEYEYHASSSDVSQLGSRYEIDIAPAIDEIQYPTQGYTLSNALSSIESGTHDVRVVVSYIESGSSMSNTLGAFEFTYDASSAEGVKAMKAITSACRAKSIANVKLPAPEMRNATLEAGIKKAVDAAGWNQEVLKVIIMDSDWQFMYDSFWGTVTDRYLNVAVVVKDKDGNCIIFYPVALQAKGSGDTYTSTFRLGGMHKLEQYIDCNNVQ